MAALGDTGFGKAEEAMGCNCEEESEEDGDGDKAGSRELEEVGEVRRVRVSE